MLKRETPRIVETDKPPISIPIAPCAEVVRSSSIPICVVGARYPPVGVVVVAAVLAVGVCAEGEVAVYYCA